MSEGVVQDAVAGSAEVASWRHTDALDRPAACATDADGVATAGAPCARPGESARPGRGVVLERDEPDGGGGAAGSFTAKCCPVVSALPCSGAGGAGGEPSLRGGPPL